MKLSELMARIHKGVNSGLLDADSEVCVTYEHDEMPGHIVHVLPEQMDTEVDVGRLIIGQIDPL